MIALNTIRKIIYISLIVFLNISLSYAVTGRKTPSPDGVLTAGPYYNPASKSYFELILSQHGSGHSQWRRVNVYAKKRFFKNTQGRLAIIRNLATHQFILRHFMSPEAFWIGLRYFCKTGALKWVDGTNIKQSDFSAWAYNWARTGVRCAGESYMPVSYSAKTPTKSFMWQATGPEKGFLYYLVEYPTGKK